MWTKVRRQWRRSTEDDTYRRREKRERDVGLILNHRMKKCVLGDCQLSERILVIKQWKAFQHIPHCCISTDNTMYKKKVTEKIYSTLNKAKNQCKSHQMTIVIGKLNVK